MNQRKTANELVDTHNTYTAVESLPLTCQYLKQKLQQQTTNNQHPASVSYAKGFNCHLRTNLSIAKGHSVS